MCVWDQASSGWLVPTDKPIECVRQTILVCNQQTPNRINGQLTYSEYAWRVTTMVIMDASSKYTQRGKLGLANCLVCGNS